LALLIPLALEVLLALLIPLALEVLLALLIPPVPLALEALG